MVPRYLTAFWKPFKPSEDNHAGLVYGMCRSERLSVGHSGFFLRLSILHPDPPIRRVKIVDAVIQYVNPAKRKALKAN